jgi:hypothetical protein
MPEPPEGEAELRDIAAAFAGAEGFVMIMLGEAAIGQRSWATKQALEKLAELRLLDPSRPWSAPTSTSFRRPAGRCGRPGGVARTQARPRPQDGC